MNVLKFLKQNVKEATGCTEPVAVAYAVAAAYNTIAHKGIFKNIPDDFNVEVPTPKYDSLIGISIDTDRNILKNAWAVGIPGTNGQKGMNIAAAMGVYCDPTKGLNLLKGVEPEIAVQANRILEGNKVYIQEMKDKSDESNIDIKVTLDYQVDENVKTAFVRIQEKHDNITLIAVDGKVVYPPKQYEIPLEEALNQKYESREKVEEPIPETLAGLISVVQGLTAEERDEVYKGIVMNQAIAQAGLKGDYGISVGKQLERLIQQRQISDSLITQVRIMAGAAGDARMAGADIEVMSTAGSGNQGITALIPVIVAADYNSIEKKRVSEAAMLSHLVTKYVSNYTGELSAICGCTIKAGIGAAAGVAYLLGGEEEQINNAINNMAANLTGVVCDGAKEGCALKLSTAAGTATESALMALNDMKVPSDNGIIHERAEDTMKSMGKISKAMVKTDIAIVEIMQSKI